MKKLIAIVACALLCVGTASAQNYTHSVGIRAGGSAALTYRYHFNPTHAIEGMLWFGWNNAINVTALYEWSQPVINDDFSLYYGAGAHIGAAYNDFAIGVDGIVGLEYQIPNAPIAISLDYKPAINFIHFNAYGFFDFALGVKYTF